jgi:cell division protein FtsW
MEKVKGSSGDFLFVLVVALLLGLGIAVLYSASYSHAERLGKDSLYFVVKQLCWIAVGICGAFIVSHTPLELLRKGIPFILLGGLVLSLLTFVPGLSQTISGARRWIIVFGQSFQPSEFVKFAVIIYLASLLARKQELINDPIKTILPPLIVVLAFVAIVYFQNDFSTAFYIFFVALAIFFIANMKMIYFIAFGTITIPLMAVLLFTKEYWVKKIMVLINPTTDPTGAGFQVIQAKLALAAGGFFGKGLGMGTKKLGSLPEADTDFIFAVLGEEIGFIGVLFVILLFIGFAYRGYSICMKTEDNFQYYLAFGITTLITTQAILNMLVVTGIVPSTGMPLPFFSLGGSSMLMNLIMCGILVNVSRQSRRERLGTV